MKSLLVRVFLKCGSITGLDIECTIKSKAKR